MVSKNDVKRLYLQSILSRRILTDELAQLLWKKCVETIKAQDASLEVEPYDAGRFLHFMSELNTTLNPLSLELRSQTDQVTGQRLWALVNTKADDIAQVATDYSPLEIAYFKAIIEQIVLANNEAYSISSIAALRETGSLSSSMTKTNAEGVLASFVAKGWLMKSQRGRYSLSTRTLLELAPYLKQTYADDLLECTICTELLTKGIACPTAACACRLHDHCYKTYRARQAVCPSCRAPWDNNRDQMGKVGEEAVKDGEDTHRSRGRGRARQGSDEDEDEDEVEPEEPVQSEEDETPRQSQGTRSTKAQKQKPKASSRAKGKQRAVSPQEEEEAEEEDSMEVDQEDVKPKRTRSRRHA